MPLIKDILDKLKLKNLREQPIVANTLEQLDRLTPEQRTALGIAFGIGTIVIVTMIFIKGYGTLGVLKENIGKQRGDLKQISSFSEDFQYFEKDIARIQSEIRRRPKTFKLKSFLSEQASKAGIPNELITSMQDQLLPAKGDLQESVVEIQFQNVSLKRITNFIHGVERSQNVTRVKELHIKPRADDKRYLNANMVVSTIMEIEK
ncbi:hypothetical protein ACFLRA_02145 [Bdellovibrionota bacterium]